MEREGTRGVRGRSRPALVACLVGLLVGGLVAAATAFAAEGDLSFVGCLEDTGGGSATCPSTGPVDGIEGASAIAIPPDGKNAYVVGFDDNSLAAFARNPSTGALTFVEFEDDGAGAVNGLAGAIAVDASPDGNHVYVAGFADSSLAAFARNPTTGTLSFVEFEDDGIGGVDNLAGARGVAVSPDAKHVYVPSFTDDSITTFARNPSTGALSFVEVEKRGVGGVDGLDSAQAADVSADGKHVYVTGFQDDSLAAFARNSTTGALDFVEVEKDGVGGTDGLDAADAVTTSADGKHVYVAAFGDDSLAAFARNPTTGALTFAGFEDDGLGSVDGLDGASGVVASSDGKHVYATGQIDDAIAAFAREPDLTTPDTTALGGPPATTPDNTPSFSFSSDDTLFTSFECRVDDGASFACSSPYTSFALADGPHRFQVRAVDTAGNADSTPSESSFTVDTSAPDPPAPPDTTAPDTELTSEPAASLTARKKTASATFEFTASESGSTFECRLDSASFSACPSPQSLKLKVGSHSFRVRAVDAAGNPDFSAAKWQGIVVKKKKKK